MMLPPCSSKSVRARCSQGVTLIELVLTMSITSLIVVGLASAVRLSTQSLDTSSGPTAVALDTGAAVDQLNADVRLALGFTERTANAITFTVPDRNGDGLPETIRYAWAGAGSPVTRQINGGAIANILENVQAFNLSYLTKTVQPPIIESNTQMLSYFTTPQNATGQIKTNAWEEQGFKPTLPSNAVSWKITSVELMGRRLATTGTISVRVYALDAAYKPTGAILASTTVNCSSLPTSYGWFTVNFTPVSFTPSTGAAIVIASTNSTAQSELTGYVGTSSPTVGQWYTSTATQGTSWDVPVTNSALNFKAYGTITMQGQ